MAPADQDDAPGRSHQLGSEPHACSRAGCLEDTRRHLTIGGPRDGVDLGRRVAGHRHRAETFGQGESRRVEVAHERAAATRLHQKLRDQQSDRSSAHDHRHLTGADLGALDGAECDAERLRQNCRVVVQRVRHGVQLMSGQAHLLLHSAIGMHAQHLQIWTAVGAPDATHAAGATRQERLDDRAPVDESRPRGRLEHVDQQLVTEHARIADQW